jgi:tyrosine-protein kinase Etk/Wzc
MYPNSPQTDKNPISPYLTSRDGEIDLRVILFRYLKNWHWILTCVFLGLGSGLVVNKFSTPIYRVEGTILIDGESPYVGLEAFSNFGYFQNSGGIQNEIGILKSYSVAENTVKSMDLNVQYFSEGLVNTKQIYSKNSVFVNFDKTKPMLVGGMFRLEVLSLDSFELEIIDQGFGIFHPKNLPIKRNFEAVRLPKSVFNFGDPIQLDFFEFSVNQISSMPGEEIFFKFQDTPSIARSMRGQLSVSILDKQSDILILSVQTPLNKLGEDYLDRLMETFLQMELDKKNRAVESTIQFLTQQLSGISDSLQLSEGNLQKYRSDNRIFNLSAEGSVVYAKLQELEKQRSDIQLSLNYYLSLQTNINNNQLGELVSPSVVGLNDPILAATIQKISDLQAEKDLVTVNFSEELPRVKDLNNRIQNATKVLEDNISSSVTNTQKLLSDLNGRIRGVEREISSLPETERNLIGFQRQFTINENIYTYLLQRKAEAEISLASNLPKNSILDRATTVGQIAPKRNQNLLFGLILGLIIPIGLISLKDYLNTKIEDPKELENQLKVPLIGMVGRSLAGDSLPVFNNSRSSVTESFRSLRADLSYLSPKRNNLVILFTSSVSGEGKTFVSMNMASVFALMGKKTLLLGLDLRKPRIAFDFGLSNDKGMSTCLSSDTPWQEVVKPSGYANLELILSGPIPPNPAELLLQEKFGQIIKEIKEAYDVVIFDCPPVGLVSEAKELFAFSDINFFVFRQGLSEKGHIEILNNLVTKGGVTKIYGILNDIHISKGYGYGYGYGYNYGNNPYGYHEVPVSLPWWKRVPRIKN